MNPQDGFGWDNETCTSDRKNTGQRDCYGTCGGLNLGICRRTTWNHVRIECGHMELKNHRFVLSFLGLINGIELFQVLCV